MRAADFLTFLAQPWFVVPWYAIGTAGAIWLVYDTQAVNTPLQGPARWTWPVVVFFFSVLGLALYLAASRPPGIAKREGQAKIRRFEAYARHPFRRAMAAAAFCVGGNGIGIVTAMIIARAVAVPYWVEFWFEYSVAFLLGWIVFERAAMARITGSARLALLAGFRVEFFSMMTLMAGWGIVTGTITPVSVGQQPPPLTFAFWGFAALGLLAGTITTLPMSWIMSRVGPETRWRAQAAESR